MAKNKAIKMKKYLFEVILPHCSLLVGLEAPEAPKKLFKALLIGSGDFTWLGSLLITGAPGDIPPATDCSEPDGVMKVGGFF